MSNHTKKKKYSVQTRSSAESILLLFPLLLIVVILPLIVRMHSYHTGLNIYDWYTEADQTADFFLYYKQWYFVGFCGLAALIAAGRAIWSKKTLKFNKLLLPLAIYALLAFVSTLFSKYRTTGFTGAYEQFENVFCILGYVLVAYYAFLIIESEEELRLMINAVAIGALIMGIIGTLQTFGLDPMATRSIKSMVVEPGLNPDDLGIVFDQGRAYGTLYNPNYIGVYTSLMIPLFTVMFFFAKKISEYLLYGAVVITSIISLVGSQSKSGIISIVAAFIFAAIMLRKYLLKKWKIIVPVIAALIITFIVVDVTNHNAYLNAIKNALTTTTPTPNLTAIETKSDHIEITYKGNTFNVALDDYHNLRVTDSEGNELSYDFAGDGDAYNLYLINDARFTEVYPFVYTNSEYLANHFDFGIFVDGQSYDFSTTYDKENYLHFTRYGKFAPIITPEIAIFGGNENFASGRGYIWSRTIPLLKKYVVLGSGADSFLQAFPQYDYVGYKNFGYNAILVSKPHSLYLQIGVQSGVLSLIAFLAFFILYSIQCFKLYWKTRFESFASRVGLAIFVGIISYLVSGISNDSSISVAPVFWVIVGIGFTANIIEKKLINAQN